MSVDAGVVLPLERDRLRIFLARMMRGIRMAMFSTKLEAAHLQKLLREDKNRSRASW
ncbi:hypothetical protein Hanom_Chr15g01410001 [Helianthus anomalus]